MNTTGLPVLTLQTDRQTDRRVRREGEREARVKDSTRRDMCFRTLAPCILASPFQHTLSSLDGQDCLRAAASVSQSGKRDCKRCKCRCTRVAQATGDRQSRTEGMRERETDAAHVAQQITGTTAAGGRGTRNGIQCKGSFSLFLYPAHQHPEEAMWRAYMQPRISL